MRKTNRKVFKIAYSLRKRNFHRVLYYIIYILCFYLIWKILMLWLKCTVQDTLPEFGSLVSIGGKFYRTDYGKCTGNSITALVSFFLLLLLHVSNVNKLSWVKFDLCRSIAGWNILWIAECKYFALLIRFAPMSSRCCSMTEANFRLAVVFATRIQDPECSHAYSVWLLISNAVYSNCRWRQPHQTLCAHLQSVWTKGKHRHDPLIY